MKDPQFARDLAGDLRDFVAAIRGTKDPKQTLTELLIATHKHLPNVEPLADAILDLFAGPDPIRAVLSKRNSPILQPLLTLYGGPAEQELGDELWGEGWGVAGRYQWKGVQE